MRVLVLGRSGQLARALAASRPPGITATYADRATADLSRPGSVARAIAATRPDLLILAAAWTDVDSAESDPRGAWAVNAVAPAEVGRAAAALGTPVIHVSTDYVFDGEGSHFRQPDEAIGPLNVYGASKAAGEIALACAQPRHVILRTSWVYDARGRNFLTTMAGLAGRAQLRVVDDQIGRPTAAADLAAAIWHLAPKLAAGGPTGVFHLTGAGDPVSWHGFAQAIFAGLSQTRNADRMPALIPIPSAQWPTPARRPRNSRLALDRFADSYGLAPPDWRDALAREIARMEQRP